MEQGLKEAKSLMRQKKVLVKCKEGLEKETALRDMDFSEEEQNHEKPAVHVHKT